MITFLNTIKSEESSSMQVDASPKRKDNTFVFQYFNFLDGPYTIPFSNVDKYITTDDEINVPLLNDLLRISGKLQSLDIKEVIKNSRNDHTVTNYTLEELKKQYEKFKLESRMKFPYRINLYYHTFHYVPFLDNLKNIMNNLNHAAFLATSEYEIDSIIKETKETLKYELGYPDSAFGSVNPPVDDCDPSSSTLEEAFFSIMNPFTIENLEVGERIANAPFYRGDNYALMLTAPYKYKFKLLEPLKGIFKQPDNALYATYREGGVTGLKKKVLTHRADDIIGLYLLCQYLVYLSVEMLLKFTNELHAVSNFIYQEIEEGNVKETEVCIPPSVHELFKQAACQIPDADSSSEASGMPPGMKENIRIDQVDESYKKKLLQLQKIYIKIFKVGISKLTSKANSLFFKKYYGRIPHLYKQYANQSMVVENTMLGDPSDILNVQAIKYIEHMADDATQLFGQLIQIAQRLASIYNVEEKINIISGYCKKYKINKDDPASIPKSIINETYYRIASSILQKNEIYGFTVDGIMQNKKFPPANHIITSLFVENPHEKPREISVSDIFSSEKGILLFAHPERLIKFNNVYRQSASKIIDTFNPKMAGLAEKNMSKAAKRFADQIMKQEVPASNSMRSIDPKEQKNISNKINKAVIKAIDMAISQKRRCLQCSGIAHDMIARVTDLAKRCVVAMLETERGVTDFRKKNKVYYKSGNALRKNRSVNKQLERNRQHIERNSGNDY